MIRSIRKQATLLTTMIIYSMVDSPSASAYIDPGTGSVLLQTLIATVSIIIAALFGLRAKLALLWKRLIRRSNAREITTDSENPCSAPSPKNTNKDAT